MPLDEQPFSDWASPVSASSSPASRRLAIAACSGSLSDAQDALDCGADTRICLGGLDPLMLACRSGHAACVELLMDRISPERPAAGGERALHVAALAGQPGAVEALLRSPSGSRLCTLRNFQGETPLMLAASAGDALSVSAMLPLSDPDARDAHGRNALMRALGKGSAKAARALAGSTDLSAADDSGRSAFHWACQSCDLECIALAGSAPGAMLPDRSGLGGLAHFLAAAIPGESILDPQAARDVDAANAKALNLILGLGADPRGAAGSPSSERPLALAARRGHGALAEPLLLAHWALDPEGALAACDAGAAGADSSGHHGLAMRLRGLSLSLRERACLSAMDCPAPTSAPQGAARL